MVTQTPISVLRSVTVQSQSWFPQNNADSPLQWRHNERDCILNHRRLYCLLSFCSSADQRKHESSASLAFVKGNSPVTGEFPAQRASKAENVSIWWRHGDHFNMPVPVIYIVSSGQSEPRKGKLNRKCLTPSNPWLFFFTCGQFWPSGICCLRLCVCPSACVCVSHELVRAITRDPFKLGPPNLDQRCKTL